MLEHLRMRPLKKTKTTTANENDSTSTSSTVTLASSTAVTMSTNSSDTIDDNPGTLIKDNRANQKTNNDNDDEVDNAKVSVMINETRKISLKEIPNGTISLLEYEKKFDPKKRYSIGNGDLRTNGKPGYELSPAPRSMQRKLSADMRLRGSNNQLNDDYAIRRPVRLRSMATNFEVYDSLHVRALDVSKFSI